MKNGRLQLKDVPQAEVLAAVLAYHDSLKGDGRPAPTPDVALASKYPVALILGKMQQLIDRGVLDCGVSVRTAWLKTY